MKRKPHILIFTNHRRFKIHTRVYAMAKHLVERGHKVRLIATAYRRRLGSFEAASLAIPLIVSDWPILRDYFSLGTVHVPNTEEGVCEGSAPCTA